MSHKLRMVFTFWNVWGKKRKKNISCHLNLYNIHIPLFINNILTYSQVHSFTYYKWQLPHYNGKIDYMATNYLFLAPYWKKSLTPVIKDTKILSGLTTHGSKSFMTYWANLGTRGSRWMVVERKWCRKVWILGQLSRH